jgi:hypothetical protein
MLEDDTRAVEVPAADQPPDALRIGRTGKTDEKHSAPELHVGRVPVDEAESILATKVEMRFTVDVLPRWGPRLVPLEGSQLSADPSGALLHPL